MILHEGGYEVVAVVVALVPPEAQGLVGLSARALENLRVELLIQELVRCALIHEYAAAVGERALADQLARIVLAPFFLVGAKVSRERLLAPRRARRRGYGGKRGDASVPVWVLEGDGESAVATHRVSEDAPCVRLGGEALLHDGGQLVGDVGGHLVVERPRL